MDKDIRPYLHYYLGFDAVFDNQVWQITQVGKKYVRLIRPGEFHKYVDVHLEDVKPILRKLESMEDGEAIEIFNLLNQSSSLSDEGKAVEVKRQIGSRKFYSGVTNLSGGDWAKIFHYLLSRGFDLFGLCDAGLAIDKSTI